MVIKSEEHLHFEVMIAALRLAEQVDLLFEKRDTTPALIREAMQTYRDKRHAVGKAFADRPSQPIKHE